MRTGTSSAGIRSANCVCKYCAKHHLVLMNTCALADLYRSLKCCFQRPAHAFSGRHMPPRASMAAASPRSSAARVRAQVASLHSWGGALSGCCAASHAANLAVYPMATTPGEVPCAKAAWQAHAAPVTALHRSAHGMQLISGAADGSLHLCARLRPGLRLTANAPAAMLVKEPRKL